LGRSKKVITMEMLGKIPRMHVRDKISVRAIAKRTGLSRNTLQKWLQTPEEIKVPKYVRAKEFSKLGVFADELEQALKADAKRNKQDRRTGKALFIQIKASGYTGGYTRVTDFIRAWRGSAGKDVKAFVPLKFDLGEAFQFDWSEEGLVAVESVIESGVLSTEHVLNVLARLNAAPVPESVESSLHLRKIPVANTGRYDSLRTISAVVVEVGHA
jgi:transcriptional regulator with XRE-family HTH domain